MPTCIIGDVHGHADQLRALLDAVRRRFGDDVEFVCVGDFIDRGPDSKRVVELAIQSGILGLLGNHEIWMVDYLLKGDFWPGVLNPMMGARATVESYNDGSIDVSDPLSIGHNLMGAIPETHQEYYKTLRCSHRVDIGGTTYWVSHGGLKAASVERIRAAAGQPVPEVLLMGVATHVELDSLLWEHTNLFPLYQYLDGSVQVYGHCPRPQVESTPTHIALDTGCGRVRRKPNWLSGVVLTEDGARHIISDGNWTLSGGHR